MISSVAPSSSLASCSSLPARLVSSVFPDTRSRLHALTKADNIGLALVLIGVALQVGSGSTAVLLLITWVLVLGAASVSAQTLAGVEADNSSEVASAGRGESA